MIACKRNILCGVLFFLSLTANVFMGSLLLGEHLRGGKEGRWQERQAYLEKNLSAEDRAVLKEGFGKGREDFKAHREKMREAKAAVFAAMRSEPFDQKALDDALKAEQALKAEMMMSFRKKREDVMKNLSPEGREVMKKMDKKFEKRDRAMGDDMGRGPRHSPPQEP